MHVFTKVLSPQIIFCFLFCCLTLKDQKKINNFVASSCTKNMRLFDKIEPNKILTIHGNMKILKVLKKEYDKTERPAACFPLEDGN